MEEEEIYTERNGDLWINVGALKRRQKEPTITIDFSLFCDDEAEKRREVIEAREIKIPRTNLFRKAISEMEKRPVSVEVLQRCDVCDKQGKNFYAAICGKGEKGNLVVHDIRICKGCVTKTTVCYSCGSSYFRFVQFFELEEK
jgi:hypothetical protein